MTTMEILKKTRSARGALAALDEAGKNRLLLKECIQACLDNPVWRLSLQTHKYLDIR